MELIDLTNVTDMELLEFALAELHPTILELVESETAGGVLTDELIAGVSDEDLRDVYGLEDDDIGRLRLSEEEESQLPANEWLLSSMAREHILLVNQAVDYRPGNTRRPSKSMPSLDWSPKKNWVDRKGVMKSSGDRGLPEYISRLAKQFTYAKKLGRQKAIQWAVGIADRWCKTGRVRKSGAGKLNPGSRAQACAAMAQWRQMKAR